jgi:hypothetical protein
MSKYTIKFNTGRGVEMFLTESELEDVRNFYGDSIQYIFKGKENEVIFES